MAETVTVDTEPSWRFRPKIFLPAVPPPGSLGPVVNKKLMDMVWTEATAGGPKSGIMVAKRMVDIIKAGVEARKVFVIAYERISTGVGSAGPSSA